MYLNCVTGEGDYVCHHAGVGHIETVVVTHAKEFLTTLIFSEVYNNK